MNTLHHSLLPQASFSILLALSLKPRHGYQLMEQIKYDSGGKVSLGPGTLYGTVKRLREDNLIEDMPFEDNDRRRYYRLTKKGWDWLGADMDYYKNILKLAHERRFLG